jgi:hypothetical protein
MILKGRGNRVQSTSIRTDGWNEKALEISKDASDNHFASCSFNGIVQINGNGNGFFDSGSLQGLTNIMGCKNSFACCSLEKVSVTEDCENFMDGQINYIRERIEITPVVTPSSSDGGMVSLTVSLISKYFQLFF